MTTTSFETQCIINAINARLNAYEKKRRQKERDRKEKRFKLSLFGRGREERGRGGGFYSSIILPIDDLNIDPI